MNSVKVNDKGMVIDMILDDRHVIEGGHVCVGYFRLGDIGLYADDAVRCVNMSQEFKDRMERCEVDVMGTLSGIPFCFSFDKGARVLNDEDMKEVEKHGSMGWAQSMALYLKRWRGSK